jgi:hypothetical protein
MKLYAQPNHSVALNARHTAMLLGVLFGIVATGGSALAQSGPYDCSGVEGVALSNCRALNAAAKSGSAQPQSAPGAWVGVAKPAAYECSGLDGEALRSCRALNAAAARRAVEQRGSPTGRSNNCIDLTGAALSRCRDLNGEVDAYRAAEII